MDFSTIKPNNEIELFNWLKLFTGMTIPTKTVMPNATASPFDFISDIYFQRVSDALLLAGRDSGKTTDVALAAMLLAKFYPNLEVGLVGAIASQAHRSYSYIKRWAPKFSDCKYSFMSETRFNNDSFIQILSGTVNGLNSPHPNIGVFDEFELTDEVRFNEFENILHSSKDFNAIEILTTSIKFPQGLAVKILTESGYSFTEAGIEPAVLNPNRNLYLWTSMDVAEPCTLSDCSACKALVRDGRSFYDVCQGRLKEANGFLKISDLQRKFMKLPKADFDAQNLVMRPELEGMLYPWFPNAIQNFEINLDEIKNYQIVAGLDFGGKPDPCVLLLGFIKDKKIYLFKEIYTTKDSPSQFMEEIKREVAPFKKVYMFADPSAKAFWLEARQHNLRFYAPVTREILEGVDFLNSFGSEGIIVHPTLKNLIFEASAAYRTYEGFIKAPNGNHALDALRYMATSVGSLRSTVREV